MDRGQGRSGEERSPSSSSFSLFLMSAAAAESIRHISGQELRVPFILPSFLPSFLPPPFLLSRPRPEMCCIRLEDACLSAEFHLVTVSGWP